jgi:hypothetical protein
VRYFDGLRWTDHTAPAQPASASAMVVPAHLAWASADRTGAHPNDVVHWLLPTGRTWQSIVAGYLALFTLLLWPLGPITLGLGVWAFRAGRSGHRHGRGRATFAVVSGVFGCAMTVLAITASGG